MEASLVVVPLRGFRHNLDPFASARPMTRSWNPCSGHTKTLGSSFAMASRTRCDTPKGFSFSKSIRTSVRPSSRCASSTVTPASKSADVQTIGRWASRSDPSRLTEQYLLSAPHTVGSGGSVTLRSQSRTRADCRDRPKPDIRRPAVALVGESTEPRERGTQTSAGEMWSGSSSTPWQCRVSPRHVTTDQMVRQLSHPPFHDIARGRAGTTNVTRRRTYSTEPGGRQVRSSMVAHPKLQHDPQHAVLSAFTRFSRRRSD